MKQFGPPLVLASRSPRRKQLLSEMGFEVRVVPPDIDDAQLQPGDVSPCLWVTALAFLKARRVKQMLSERASQESSCAGSHGVAGTILGADTVCVAPGGEILGQPRDADDARRMLGLLGNAEHQTITGVCLLDGESKDRVLFCDRAVVHIGTLSDEQIERYIASGEWRGKAGGYNLSERIEANWPIYCDADSDPATVMGLPVRRLAKMLKRNSGER